MTVRVEVAPELLHWALGRARWDEETTRRRAPRVAQWSTGQVRPTLKQIERFAHDTHTPFGMLFLAEPPREDVPIPDMRTLGDAEIAQPSADLLDTIYLCQDRQEWYRQYAAEHGLPALGFVGSASVDDDVEVVAARVRELLGFDLAKRATVSSWEDALRRLIDRIEATGALVMVNGVVGSNTHRRLDPKEFRGFALADRVAPLIFVNGADTKAAQIFTIIHEYAHLWLGGSALSDAAMTANSGVAEERWCNRVAAEVLVPIAALRSDYDPAAGPTLDELKRLARLYRVSTLVVLKRIYDAGFLSWDDYRARYDDERERVMDLLAARSGESAGGNYYHTQPLRLSRLFAQAVIASTFEGSTSFRDAYRLLGTRKPQTFANLAAALGVR